MSQRRKSLCPWAGRVIVAVFVCLHVCPPWVLGQSSAGESEIILLEDEAPVRRQSPERGPARTQRSAAAPQTPALGNSELRIQALWFARKAYLESEQVERAAEKLRAMQEFRRQEGITSLDSIAGAFSYEGYQHLEASRFGAAHASFRLAKEFDPKLPHVYYGQARSLRHLGMGWTAAFRETLEGIKVGLSNFSSAYPLMGNLMLIGLAAASLAGAVLLLALAWKYQPLLRHDLAERFGRRMSESTAGLLAWLVFLLPLLAGLGWVWVLIIWTVAIFPYVRSSERVLATVVLLWAVALPVALESVARVFETSVNPEVRTLVSAMRGGYDPEKIRFLKESAERDPDNAMTHFLLGALYKNGGYFNEALVHFNRTVAIDPQFHQAINNLGNLYFLTQNFAVAQQEYQKAVDLKPDFSLGYFNLHLAQYQQFNVEEAERNLEAARRLDPEGLGTLSTADLPTNVVDAQLDLDNVWESLVASSRKTKGTASPGAALHSPHALAGGASLLAAYGLMFYRRKRKARRCYKCGKPFCSRCRSGTQFPDFCTQCVHLFAKRTGLAPNTKKAKLEEVRCFQNRRRRLSRLLSVLAPGLGHAWGDRCVLGFVAMLLWSFCLIAGVAHDQLLRFSDLAYANASSPAGLLCIAGGALVWLIVNLIPPLARS